MKCKRLTLAISSSLIGAAFAPVAHSQDFPTVLSLSTLDGNTGFRLDGTSYDHAGRSVSKAGDVNDDGIEDLLIGADFAEVTPAREGKVYAVFGRNTLTSPGFPPTQILDNLDGIAGFAMAGIDGGDFTGRAVTSVGDINGDGIDDIAIGAYGGASSNSGRAYVVFGRNSSTAGNFPQLIDLGSISGADGFRIDGNPENWLSGYSVSGAGDVNGDGIDDLIIGTPGGEPDDLFLAGRAHVVFGRNTDIDGQFPAVIAVNSLDGSNGFSIDAVQDGDNLGFSVSGSCDINGDGIDDLVVGAPHADPNGYDSGSTYIVFGVITETFGNFPPALSVSTLNGSTGLRIDGSQSGARMGRKVSCVGDVNADGFNELMIGSWDGTYILYGRDTDASGDFPAILTPADFIKGTGFRFETSATAVNGAGDINGDGIDDIIVGTTYSLSSRGSSYVIFGRDPSQTYDFPDVLLPEELDGTIGFRIDGESSGDRSGFSVSGAGDINGDGVDDLIIGAPAAAPDGDRSGSAYVLFGGNDGPGTGRIKISANLTTLNFDDLPGSPPRVTVTLTNQAYTSPQLGILSIEGSENFIVANDNCSNQILAPMGSVNDACTFEIEIEDRGFLNLNGTLIAPYNSTLGPERIELNYTPLDALFSNRFATD